MLKKALPIILGATLLAACSSDDEPTKKEQKDDVKQEQTNGESESVKDKKEKEESKVVKPETEQNKVLTKDKAIKGAKAVLDTQKKAIEEENIDLYMSTLLTGGEQADYTKTQLEKSFDINDVDVKFEDIKVKSVSDDFRKVILEVVQITKNKEENRDFIDSKVTTVQTFEYISDTWLKTSTQQTDMQALE